MNISSHNITCCLQSLILDISEIRAEDHVQGFKKLVNQQRNGLKGHEKYRQMGEKKVDGTG